MSARNLVLDGVITQEELRHFCFTDEQGPIISQTGISYHISIHECVGYDGEHSVSALKAENCDYMVHVSFFKETDKPPYRVPLGLFHQIGALVIVRFYDFKGEQVLLYGHLGDSMVANYQETWPYMLLKIALRGVERILA